MSLRKLAFLLGFPALAGATWLLAVSPALARHHRALAELQGADKFMAENRQLVANRDRLASEWAAFRGMADEGIRSLEDFLNPLLIQKRVFSCASNLGCDLRIQEDPSSLEAGAPRYSFSAEGEYANLVRFLDRLERGDYRVRFESLTVILPADESASREGVAMNATFLIPRIPPTPGAAPPPAAEQGQSAPAPAGAPAAAERGKP